MEKIAEKNTIINNLIKNTDVLEMQFESFGLKVSSIGYELSNHSDYWLCAFVEIISSGKGKLVDDFQVKVNLYNESGNLIGNEFGFLEGSEFNGFETFNLAFQNDGIGLAAHKARIFITKD